MKSKNILVILPFLLMAGVILSLSGCLEGGTIEVGPFALTYPDNQATSVSITPTFTWEAAENAAVYKLTVATNTNFTEGVIVRDNITTTSATLAVSLSFDTSYHWKVEVTSPKAVQCNSPFSFMTAGALEVSSFNLVAPANNAQHVSVNPVFTWGVASNATEYKLTVAIDAAFTDIVETKENLTTNSATLETELDTNTMYHWKVEVTEPESKNCNTNFRFTTINAAFIIDNFENYTDDAALNAKWDVEIGMYGSENDGGVKLTTAANQKNSGAHGMFMWYKSDCGLFTFTRDVDTSSLEQYEGNAISFWMRKEDAANVPEAPSTPINGGEWWVCIFDDLGWEFKRAMVGMPPVGGQVYVIPYTDFTAEGSNPGGLHTYKFKKIQFQFQHFVKHAGAPVEIYQWEYIYMDDLSIVTVP